MRPISDNLVLLFFFFKDDIAVLLESAKKAASASDFTVSNIAERLRNISQEMDNMDIRTGKLDLFSDADQMGEFILYP